MAVHTKKEVLILHFKGKLLLPVDEWDKDPPDVDEGNVEDLRQKGIMDELAATYDIFDFLRPRGLNVEKEITRTPTREGE